ncbi:uncharacterized protein LOC144819091 [Lissotriton helveticus]
MKRYNPFVKRPVLGGSQPTINRYYRTLTPLVMDEDAQQETPRAMGCDVTGFGNGICRPMEAHRLKDCVCRMSPIKGDSSDSEVSCSGSLLAGLSSMDLEEAEEAVAPPNTPVYEDMDLQEDKAAEKVVLHHPATSVEDDGASQDISDSQDFRAAAEDDENAKRANPIEYTYLINYGKKDVAPPSTPSYDAMDLQEDTGVEKGILQQPGTSVEDDGASQDISDSQDFRAAAESGEYAERETPKRPVPEWRSTKANNVIFNCLWCSKQAESSTCQNRDGCDKCVCNSDMCEKEDEGLSYYAREEVKAFAAQVVLNCVRRDYYSLCNGHQINDPQQDAHECLCESYRARTIRYICSLIDPYKVYKLLRVVYGSYAEKKLVHPDMLRILTAAINEIRYAYDPSLKLPGMQGMGTTFNRKMIEKLVARRMCNLYKKNRKIGSLAPRKLF